MSCLLRKFLSYHLTFAFSSNIGYFAFHLDVMVEVFIAKRSLPLQHRLGWDPTQVSWEKAPVVFFMMVDIGNDGVQFEPQEGETQLLSQLYACVWI